MTPVFYATHAGNDLAINDEYSLYSCRWRCYSDFGETGSLNLPIRSNQKSRMSMDKQAILNNRFSKYSEQFVRTDICEQLNSITGVIDKL